MATAETVALGPPHQPLDESLTTFELIQDELKREVRQLRHNLNKHEPEFFAATRSLSDEELTDFNAQDFVLVRVAKSAYGLHLLGKLLLPDSEGLKSTPQGGAYIHFRVFVAGDKTKLHSIQTQEIENADGTKSFKAIYSQTDPLEWFDV